MIRLLVFCLLLAPMAQAQQPEAVAAYMAGEYSKAVRLSEASGSADDLALAARAVLAEAMSVRDGEPAQAALEHAEALARKAITLEESHVDGRLHLAISLSLQVRPMSNRQARRSRLGGQAKSLAEDILADNPGNVLANGLLAVWNVEVLRRGGRIGGRIMGASIEQGRAHYQAGVETDPDDGALHWQWARVLAATNPRKYGNEIEMALDAAIDADTDDALEQVMQARARHLREVLQSLSPREVKALASSLL